MGEEERRKNMEGRRLYNKLDEVIKEVGAVKAEMSAVKNSLIESEVKQIETLTDLKYIRQTQQKLDIAINGIDGDPKSAGLKTRVKDMEVMISVVKWFAIVVASGVLMYIIPILTHSSAVQVAKGG